MARRVWPLDVWASALRRTGTSWAVFRVKADCDRACKQRPGWRAWAFDLGSKAGATNQPKRYVAAPLKSFAAAYQLVPSEHRHAYEIVEGACHLFFDLEYTGVHLAHGDEMAQQVAAAARETVAELAAAQHHHVRIDTVAFDSAHNDKFSRHLLLMMSTEHGAPVLLRGPCEAGAVAARVAERVGREGAALVIDRSVYAPGRAILRNIRFQISDFRFQIPTPRQILFGRFQILDLRSPRGTRANILKGSRTLCKRFCRFLRSEGDPKSRRSHPTRAPLATSRNLGQRLASGEFQIPERRSHFCLKHAI